VAAQKEIKKRKRKREEARTMTTASLRSRLPEKEADPNSPSLSPLRLEKFKRPPTLK
jgi:hypothetical protein